jgi:AraC-like DNA-binding protein
LNISHSFDISTNGENLGAQTAGSFSIARVRYAPNVQLSDHVHPHTSIVLPVTGSFWEAWGQQSVLCTPGCAVVERAGEPHEDRFGEAGAVNVVIRIRSPLLEEPLESRVTAPTASTAALAEQIHQSFDDPAADELDREHQLLMVLSRCLGASPPRRREPAWISEAIHLVWELPREARSICRVAELLDVSPVRLARCFRHRYNMSLTAYIRSVRDTLAAQMLYDSSRPLCEIALDLGYSDQAHMTRALRAHRGVTPGEMRRFFSSLR